MVATTPPMIWRSGTCQGSAVALASPFVVINPSALIESKRCVTVSPSSLKVTTCPT